MSKTDPVHIPPLVVTAHKSCEPGELDHSIGNRIGIRHLPRNAHTVRTPWRIIVDGDPVYFTRSEFTEIVRLGSAALAQTHPDRAVKRVPCSHPSRTTLPHTDGRYEGEMCNCCGELLRSDAAPTGAEGAE